ncbi:hypothetical protein BH09ACT7_BH09ACT7_33170 [soil metagenome]
MTWRKSLVRLLSLIVIGCLAVSCSASLPAVQRAVIGMTIHVRGADKAGIKRQFDLMTAMHVKWVRVDVGWAWVESERGQFDWTDPDTVVDEAKARGMNVLIVLAFTPAWARSSGAGHAGVTPYSRPTQMSEFADFARIAAQRYASRGVRNWEIWNEPNLRRFWPPRPAADEYGDLFRSAAAAIRGVDSKARLLIAGLSPKYGSSDDESSPVDYLEKLYDNGTAQLADAIAVHPYSFPAMPMAAQQRMIGGFKDLPALHTVMDNHGDGKKKIWITEFGSPTGSGPNSVSEQDQAAALVQAHEQFQQWDWAGALIYYELVDAGENLSDNADNFGVLRESLDPKPAAVALMQAGSGG